MGVPVVGPRSGDIVYSPTAVMRLENSGIPHPSPMIMILIIMLILGLLTALVIRILLGICRVFRKLLRKSPPRELSSRNI